MKKIDNEDLKLIGKRVLTGFGLYLALVMMEIVSFTISLRDIKICIGIILGCICFRRMFKHFVDYWKNWE